MLALTSLTGYEGHAPPIQYLPNKHHHHFGLSFFVCAKVKMGILSILPFMKERVSMSVNMEYLLIQGLTNLINACFDFCAHKMVLCMFVHAKLCIHKKSHNGIQFTPYRMC